MLDVIKLTNIRAMGKHGVNPGERDTEQVFHIEIEFHLNLRKPQATDHLIDTVDYALLHGKIVEIVKSTSYSLLERLAAEIINLIFTDSRIVQAQVSISKPDILNGCTPTVILNRVNPGPW
jgi:dihydroneopterin aldolase